MTPALGRPPRRRASALPDAAASLQWPLGPGPAGGGAAVSRHKLPLSGTDSSELSLQVNISELSLWQPRAAEAASE